MSVEAVSWALSVPVGGNAKVVLLGLANHAHPDGSGSYPALDTLKVYAHCDRSTVRRNLRRLEDDGWIQSDGIGPKGQTKWSLPVGGGKTPRVASALAGGGTGASEGVAPMPPEPSLEPSIEPPDSGNARTIDVWPDGLPDLSVANDAFNVITEVAAEHGSKLVTRRAIGHAILSAPGRDYVGEAHRMASYFADRKVRDAVATYRNWLGNADPAGTTNGLTSSRRGGWTAREMYELGQQEEAS